MRILITGATGFIGKHLLNRLIKEEHDVCAIVRPSTKTGELEQRNIRFYIDDGSTERLVQFMLKERFNGVVHLASKSLLRESTNEVSDLVVSNILFSARLLEASVQANVLWFINTGTFWQHYKNKQYSPVNLYAATKQAFEDIAQFYIEASSINFVTLKINDTFGPNDVRPKIHNLWMQIAGSGKTLDMSAGEQIIETCYIENVLDAYIKLVDHLNSNDSDKYRGKSFAIKVNESLRLRDLKDIFEKVIGEKIKINWGNRPYGPREVMVPWKDGKKVPGWEQKVSLEEGIRRTFEYANRSKGKNDE